MTHTYKHQLAYKAKHFRFRWDRPQIKEDPFKDFPWHKVPRNRDKQFWRTTLWHSFKQKNKRKMQRGDFDNLLYRPERYAWIID